MVIDTLRFLGSDRFSAAITNVIAEVPRHEFVPPSQRPFAYQNRPLSIGYGQTISQPYIVAYMTELLQLNANAKVLEIGTGCGYQTAILAKLCKTVYSIEIVEPLAQKSKQRLQRLHYENVHCRLGDGYYGWPEHAGFDAIMLTAAAPNIPPALIEQLNPGGRLILPLGEAGTVQDLILIAKDADGEVLQQKLIPVVFVPLTGKH